MGVKSDNVKWVDGLRGLASFLVVVTHLLRACDPDAFRPASSEKVPPRFIQWPFIRVFLQGRIGVSIFSLVTGYVCALKPIRQARSGNMEGAVVGVGKSAFRRIPRIVLPTTIATVLTWFVCQFGVFEIARHANNPWLSYTAPERTPYFGDAVRSLFFNVIETWVYGRNAYDANHWNLQPLLKGSMLVYISVIATIYMQPKYRMMISMAQWIYYYIGNDSAFGMQLFFGMFLADLSNHTPAVNWSNARPWIRNILSPLLLILGLGLASYPEEQAEWVSWSFHMQKFSAYFLPQGHDIARFYTAFGLELIALSIHFSPTLKDMFSNRYFLWLGKNSFGVYLIHGTLIRWVLAWCLFGVTLPAPRQNEKGEWHAGPNLTMKGPLVRIFWIPLWFVLVYFLGNLWINYVDPMCARWTVAIEQYIWADNEKGQLNSPLPS